MYSTNEFSKRVTLESQPDGRKFGRKKVVDTRTRNIVAPIYTTASFGLKLRIDKVGGNRERTAVSCHKHLSFNEEEKMRFRGGEVMIHRLEIRSKAANVAEVDIEKVRGSIKTHVGVTDEYV